MDIDTIRNDYILKKYPGVSQPTITDYDEKMIKSIFVLRTSYQDEFEKRRCSVMLKEIPRSSIFEKQQTKPKKENITEIKNSSSICTAILMNGKPCTCKAKPGESFCGRHLKK